MFWPKEECSGPKEEGSNPEKVFLTQRKNVPTYEDVSEPCSDLGRCSEAMHNGGNRGVRGTLHQYHVFLYISNIDMS